MTERLRELTMGEARLLDLVVPCPATGDRCLARYDGRGTHYTCTRRLGHDGVHVAHTPAGPVAVWTESDALPHDFGKREARRQQREGGSPSDAATATGMYDRDEG